MHTPIAFPACIMLLLALLLQGCGHKGPLVLPQAKSATHPNDQGKSTP